MERRKAYNRIYFCVIAFLLVALSVLGLLFGSVNISLSKLAEVILGRDTTSATYAILYSVRLPRVLASLLTGAGLGTAGVVLQSVLNNSLASSNTIGVNSGAGFFVMLSILLFPQNLAAKSLMAFIGAFATSAFILCLAYFAERSRVTIILAGVTISGFLVAAMNAMKIIDDDLVVNTLHFSIGSLSGVTMKNLLYPSIGIVTAITLALIFSKALNILTLGDGTAHSLGLNVNLYRIFFILISSALAGFVVCFSGLIGFVGLIIPHICRYFFRQDARLLLPASMLTGAVFVLAADLIGRVLFAPYEIPVGIILSLSGAPFFLYLLLRRGGKRVNA